MKVFVYICAKTFFMKSSGLVIISAIFMAFCLTIGGGYITIDNLMHPQGNLFEGIVITSLGIVFFLLLAIAATLGKTIQTFTDVYLQQVEMQQKMISHFDSLNKSKPKSISDIISGLGGLGDNSITITNLETGETSTRPLGGNPMEKINDMIINSLSGAGKKPKDLVDMNREELEKELAKAVKKDDYEKAKEIKDLLQKIDDNPEED